MPRRSAVRPPGPSSIATFAKLISGRFDVTRFATDLTTEFPRIAHLRVPGDHVYALHHPDLIRAFFVENSTKVEKADALKKSTPLLGNGLLTSEGSEWKRHRKMVQPAFHVTRIHRYADLMAANAAALRDSWADGQSIEIAAAMSGVTLNIVGEALFGDELGVHAARVAPALNHALEGTARRFTPLGRALSRVPTKTNRDAKAGVKYLSTLVHQIAKEHRDAGDRNDLLSLLIAATDDDDSSALSHQQVVDEAMTLILAGHETTAMALTWAWMLLQRNRTVREQLHAEIDAVLTDEHTLTFDDFARLPYTRAVFAESLRLFPPAWIMGRKTIEDMEIDGWHIPATSTIACWPYVLHRDKRFWDRPASFDPRRWITSDGTFDDSAPGQPLGSWLAFGIGQRKCVGQMFAWVEGVFILATLARQWNLEIPIDFKLQVTPAITLRPHHGIPATVRSR